MEALMPYLFNVGQQQRPGKEASIMQNLLRSVGERIRSIRKEQRISQEKLAERAGLHFTYIGGVERGERNIGLENLSRIATALGMEIRDLCPAKDPKQDNMRELIAILKCKDKKTVDLIREIVKRIPCRGGC